MISIRHIMRVSYASLLFGHLSTPIVSAQSSDVTTPIIQAEQQTPLQISPQTERDVGVTSVQADTVYVGTYGTRETNVAARTDVNQNFCIDVITGFPNDDQVSRYQFFKLTDELALDSDIEFKRALMAYEQDPIPTDIPILDVVELIANPVLRQAAPEVVVASMHHLIEFNGRCAPYVMGQISSLTAFDPTLTDSDIVIAEDALYLRQILLDSLARLGASESPIHKVAVLNYTDALVRSRDAIEFQAYENDVSDVEALFMSDLDGRLARSNDLINNEIDREILGDAVNLSDDLIGDLKRKQKEEGVRTLARILNRF